MGLINQRAQYDYFESFKAGARSAGEAAAYLYGALSNFHAEEIPKHVAALHAIESAADTKKHELMKNLAQEFITPIEREDIAALAHEIDNIVDAIEEVIRRIYMFNIQKLRADAVSLAGHIVQCGETFEKITEEFSNFKKSKSLGRLIVEVNTLESEGDALHLDAMRRLYTGAAPAEDRPAWTSVYTSFEDCFDAYEHAADVIERVVMNNM